MYTRTCSVCKKVLIGTVFFCILILSLALSISAETPNAASTDTRVYDPADLLTGDEEAALHARLDALTEKHGVQLYFATYHARNYADDFVGDDYCDTIRNLYSQTAVLLIVTYDESDGRYYYDMYTYREADFSISDKEVNYILDRHDVYDNLKGGRILIGAEAFFDQAAEAHSGRVGVSYAIIVPICLVFALLIGAGVASGVAASYRKRKPSVDYPLDRFAQLELTAEADTFAGSAVTRTYVPRNSGSSGGGSRSSHGGGGGHRGGR